MRDIGVGSWPRRRIKNGAHRTAVVFEEQAFTYGELEERIRRLANALRSQGVGPGDRVAYLGFNHHSLLESFFAVNQLGAIWVIINARLTPGEVEYILSDSGAKVAIIGAEHHGHANKLAGIVPVQTWVHVDGGPGQLDYEQVIGAAGADEIDEPVTWDDPALIMYTSGTTGRPKGAVHTHGSLSMQYFSALIDTDFTRDEVHLSVAPLFHVAGLNTMTLPTFLKGGTIVIHHQFNAGDVLAAIGAHGVTSMFAVPAMMDALAMHPGFSSADLRTLRSVLVGGAPLPERMLRTWHERGVQVQQGYGMTETAPGVFLLLAEDSFRKSGSAGRPHFFTEGRVVRPDGSDIGPGEHGEVIAQGPNVMKEYWGRPKETAEVIVDGWYRTGDIATLDDDGYVYIKDRIKDMFISGGENIYPAEVENALLDVPGVAEAAVIGVADERWGEVGHAYLVLLPGAELTSADVEAHLADRLARYKIPKQIAFVPELPKTATGKLRKHIIRTKFEEHAT